MRRRDRARFCALALRGPSLRPRGWRRAQRWTIRLASSVSSCIRLVLDCLHHFAYRFVHFSHLIDAGRFGRRERDELLDADELFIYVFVERLSPKFGRYIVNFCVDEAEYISLS